MSNRAVTYAVIRGLAKYLKDNVPGLTEVYDDFPSPTQKLVYPCGSIFMGEPRFDNAMQYLVSIAANPEPGADPPQYLAKYCVGRYEFPLQVDLWTRDKFSRHELHEKLFTEFNNQVGVVTGLSLALADYHGERARYTLTSMRFVDDEAASQRGEWRLRAQVMADVRAIQEKLEYRITQIENNVEIPG